MSEKFAVIFLLGLSSVLLVNGFFMNKFKDGCDPDPCKHKAKCVLDSRNKNISTCVCVGEFHGKHCELKTGCNSSPCKKGKCENDKRDPSKFKCTCDPGYVGEQCEKADGCSKSNPCKNGAKCSLDKKNNPVCDCTPGWMSSKCDKKNCTIHEFKGKHFSKQSAKVYIDESIEARMKQVDDLAKLVKVKIHVLKSFVHQTDKKNFKYDPKDTTAPGHYIGEALSVHIYDQDSKLICNDVCLGKVPIPSAPAKAFIDGLYALKWKWSILHPTVISTDFNAFGSSYALKREQVQVGCSDKKF